MKHKALIIAVPSIILGLIFNWFFYGKLPGVSVFLYTSLILALTFYLAQQFKRPINKSIYWLAPITLFFSLMVAIRANLFLAFINICLVIYLLIMVARLGHQHNLKLKQYQISEFFTLGISTPLRILRESVQFLLLSTSSRNGKVPKSSVVPFIRGLILSLPILFIFLILLSSADLVFKNFIGSLFDFNVAPETAFRWGLIGFVTSLFTGAYAFIFMPTSASEISPVLPRKRFALGTIESSVILGSVSFLFFIFVAIQLTYFFGGAANVASTGHTYAEYARKGFFELIAVAAISLLLILSIKKYTVFRTIFQSNVFKWLSGILIAEVMVIMLSAHMRLSLYEDAYGFTTLRLWSHVCILWLAAAFSLLLFHIVRGRSEKNLAFQLFISVLCFFALINIINPDNFIAKQNISRFNKTGKIDLYYLSNLSEDATPTIARLLKHSNPDMQKRTAYVLFRQREFTHDELTGWQSANLARHRADQIFRDKNAQIEASKSHTEYLELEQSPN